MALKENTISAGANTTYWRGDKTFQTLNTTAVPEGTNLYYTDARADARVSAGTGTIAVQNANAVNIDGGAIDGTVIGGNTPAAITGTSITANSGFTGNLVGGVTGAVTGTVSDISNHDTADLSEGTNLYFTNARADARADTRIAAASLGALADTTISGTSSGQLLQWNGSAWVNATVGAAAAAGANTQVQFNDSGNIGADAGFTYNKTTDTLTTGTTYYYRISAINDYGTSSPSTASSAIASDVPAQVTNLTVTAVVGKVIDIVWTAPNNGGSAITGYKIERSTDGTNYTDLVADTQSVVVSYSDINLTVGTTYYYNCLLYTSPSPRD